MVPNGEEYQILFAADILDFFTVKVYHFPNCQPQCMLTSFRAFVSSCAGVLELLLAVGVVLKPSHDSVLVLMLAPVLCPGARRSRFSRVFEASSFSVVQFVG